jgi:hypothetical protein
MNKHLWYYITLLSVEFTGIGLLLFLSHDKYMQFITICFMSSFYIGWSIIHHYHHHNVSIKIVIEYVLIGLLGVVISFLIFQQL